jgi:hypothetical protein
MAESMNWTRFLQNTQQTNEYCTGGGVTEQHTIPYLEENQFDNRVLRRIFGPKRDEVTGEWRKLHKEELNDLYL